MKQLTCEMCGSTDLMKQEGVFVCQSCGCKYSVEEAKKMMIEGIVDVQGTVRVDASDKVKNLYIMARRAKDDNNAELASKYYEMITFENPNDWEALFYFNYFKARQTNLQNMRNSVIRFANSLDSVFDLIDKSDKTSDEKWNLAKEIITKIDSLCESYIYWAKSHYRKFSQLNNSISDLQDRTYAVAELQKNMADLLEKYFAENSTQVVISYLKSYVKNYLLLDTIRKEFVNITLRFYSNELIAAEKRIKELDPSYVPLINANTQRNSASDQNSNHPVATKGKSDTGAKVGAVIGGIIGAIIGIWLCNLTMDTIRTPIGRLNNPPQNDVFVMIIAFGAPALLGVFIGALIGSAIANKKK